VERLLSALPNSYSQGVYMVNIDFAKNYEDCAHFWAKHIGLPFGKNVYFDVNILSTYRGIYPETIEAIEIDPIAFADKVNDYLYAFNSIA
jgi:hypothetical protein